MAPCSVCSAIAPGPPLFHAPGTVPLHGPGPPSRPLDSIPPPGLLQFCLRSTTLLDFFFLFYVWLGRLEPPLEGGTCNVGFVFCVLFLFSCLLFWSLVMVPVCVMLPFPSCLLAIGSSVQCVTFWLVMCLVSHWFVHVMWPSLFVVSSHVVALFLVVYWSFNLLSVSLVCLSMPSLFMSSLRLDYVLMFGLHFWNKLHLGSHYARLQWTESLQSLTFTFIYKTCIKPCKNIICLQGSAVFIFFKHLIGLCFKVKPLTVSLN